MSRRDIEIISIQARRRRGRLHVEVEARVAGLSRVVRWRCTGDPCIEEVLRLARERAEELRWNPITGEPKPAVCP